MDNGLNTLFDDRAEEHIKYGEEIEEILKGRRAKQPDRIIGLRATKRIARILRDTEGSSGLPIGDSIDTSPFKVTANPCEPLLFPFLILEAKSEKSSDTFSKIYLQTGFAIRRLLSLQRDLINATIENRRSGTEPLVWFLANKGEDWRVYGAYIEETGKSNEPNYRILELWAGNITYDDGALGLLLIIDYIFDWARDRYRKEVISSLLSLVVNATNSLIAATDVYSTTDDFLGFNQEQDQDTYMTADKDVHFGPQHLLQFFDTSDCAIRDARYMCRSFCALYITSDNLDKLLKSAPNQREAKQHARRLWRMIQGSAAWSVTAECLNAVEKLWTDTTREHEAFVIPTQPFLAVFHVRPYFARGEDPYYSGARHGQWEQYHELTYVAVAEDALGLLREQTEFRPGSVRLDLRNCPRVSDHWLLTVLEEFLSAPTEHLLMAACSRCVFESQSEQAFSEKLDSFPAHEENRFRGVKVHLRAFFLNRSASYRLPDSAQAPRLIYKRFKIGMAEPSEPFLRVSQKFVKHERTDYTTHDYWGLNDGKLDLSGAKAVAVVGLDETRDVDGIKRSRLPCIFVLDVPEASPDATDPLQSLSTTPTGGSQKDPEILSG